MVVCIRWNAILPAHFAGVIDLLNEISPLIVDVFAVQRDTVAFGADVGAEAVDAAALVLVLVDSGFAGFSITSANCC